MNLAKLDTILSDLMAPTLQHYQRGLMSKDALRIAFDSAMWQALRLAAQPDEAGGASKV